MVRFHHQGQVIVDADKWTCTAILSPPSSAIATPGLAPYHRPTIDVSDITRDDLLRKMRELLAAIRREAN